MSVTTEVRKLEADVDALLALHDSASRAKSFGQYKDRPVEFMREVLDFHPYDKQIEVIMSFVANRQTAVRGFHGAGKDAVLAPIMMYAAYVLEMLVLAISATEKQLLGQLWTEVRNRFSDKLPGELYAADLRIRGRKRIVAMTSNNTSNLTGWHDPNGVFIAISESQSEQTEAVAFDAAIANAVDDKSRIMVVGNSIKPSGRFFEVSRKSTWHAIRISAFDHPNISGVGEAIPGGPSHDWPSRIADEYGIDSPWYIGRVLAEFPESGIDSLVKRVWIDNAFARWESGETGRVASKHMPQIIADIARGGPDSTCAAIVRGPFLDKFITWNEPDLMKTAKNLRALAIEQGAYLSGIARPTQEQLEMHQVQITVDDVGVGGGVTDRLRELGSRVFPFNGGKTPKKPERYLNCRAEAYFALREAIQRDKMALPRCELLAEELLATEYSESASGLIQLIAKKEIKQRIGRSPDRADVAAMAAHRVYGPRNTAIFHQDMYAKSR
jgi:phage terminase large subunit